MELYKIDKNGTKYYKSCLCRKCGGSGQLMEYYHVENGVCFNCGGSGVVPEYTVKEYTPEYRELLDQRAEARREKKRVNAIAKSAEKNAEWLKRKGFNENREIWVVMGETYEIKDELREKGAKFFDHIVGWTFDHEEEGYDLVKFVIADEEINYDDFGRISSIEDSFDWKVDSKKLNYLKENSKHSNYAAEVGEKISADVTYKHSAMFSNYYGYTFIYTFEDEKGNLYQWSTSKEFDFEENCEIHISGTVKSHKEYKGDAITNLTRCKVA